MRKGYSSLARIISFGWLILGFIAIFFLPTTPVEQQINAEQFSDDKTKVTQHGNVIEISPIEEKTQAEIDGEAEQDRLNVEAQQQALADEDRPHFEWPKVDYTKAVAKVNLLNDKAILKATGKPIMDQENSTNQNGEPMVSYWFSKDLTNYLQIDLSREFIDVAWGFNAKDAAKATAAFEDGQRITRALLGGQDGSALYENIAKGGKIDELNLEDGTVIKNARCGQFMCRYQVVR
ncbi:hypothetical protein QSV37_17605 [Acinetobacter sp. VNK23]|uniref:hypothetical protein n=1 Tax=Acinetobacter thutiue TaxID=2998078 RepID=UPI0025789397|nr:hypothetical protein [Acinetobacter thutiue]MDM1022091.1 hypothetical protein [Acinetobacter thutiue]